MTQEQPSMMSFKEFQRLRYPIGYVFEYVPTEGCPVDLTTPEKVSKYFGFGVWRLLSKGFARNIDDATYAGAISSDETLLYEDDTPIMVSYINYSVIDSSGTFYIMPHGIPFNAENDNEGHSVKYSPAFLPTDLNYRFVIDSEGMIYRYPLKVTVFPDDLDDYRLVYPMDDREGMYTVIMPNGIVYRYPNSIEFDPENPLESFKIDDLSGDQKTVTKYKVRNSDSQDLIDVSNERIKNDVKRHTLLIDFDRDSVYEIEAVYDYSTGIYVIDVLSHDGEVYYDVGGLLVTKLPYPVYNDATVNWSTYVGYFLVPNTGKHSDHGDKVITAYYSVKELKAGETIDTASYVGTSSGVNTHRTMYVEYWHLDLSELWPAVTKLNEDISALFKKLSQAEELADDIASSELGAKLSLNVTIEGVPEALSDLSDLVVSLETGKEDKIALLSTVLAVSSNAVKSSGIMQHINFHTVHTFVYRWVRIA